MLGAEILILLSIVLNNDAWPRGTSAGMDLARVDQHRIKTF